MLRYLIRKPHALHAQQATSMVVLLHGYGSNEYDLFSFDPDLPSDAYVVSVQAPIPLWQQAYAWYNIDFTPVGIKVYGTDEARRSLQTLFAFLKEMTQTYGIAPAHLSLCGFSQGAVMALAMAFHYPQWLKKVVAMSGYLWSELIPLEYDKTAVQQVKILMTHGTADEVIPVAMPRQGVAWLQAQNIPHIYQEYEGMGHGVSPACFQTVLQFLRQEV